MKALRNCLNSDIHNILALTQRDKLNLFSSSLIHACHQHASVSTNLYIHFNEFAANCKYLLYRSTTLQIYSFCPCNLYHDLTLEFTLGFFFWIILKFVWIFPKNAHLCHQNTANVSTQKKQQQLCNRITGTLSTEYTLHGCREKSAFQSNIPNPRFRLNVCLFNGIIDGYKCAHSMNFRTFSTSSNTHQNRKILVTIVMCSNAMYYILYFIIQEYNFFLSFSYFIILVLRFILSLHFGFMLSSGCEFHVL